jgi:hypothetical protein
MPPKARFWDSRTVDRLRARRRRLLSHRDVYERARAACVDCHRRGRARPYSIWLREAFVWSRGVQRTARGLSATSALVPSPASSLITPRGISLQSYLIAIFEAQCRCKPGAVPNNSRPLLPTRRESGWLDLVASDTADATSPATPRDNLLRQLKRALLHLERENLIELGGQQNKRGRFEYFRALDEGASPSRARYSVPRPAGEGAFPIPVEFFLNGWIHVLSPAEIVTYLMLMDIARIFPGAHDERGIFVTEEQRLRQYTLRRDVYESHRTLSMYALVRRISNTNRRPDGTVRSFKLDGNPLEPHRFQLLDTVRTENAFDVVTRSLSPEGLLLWTIFSDDRPELAPQPKQGANVQTESRP